jgi:cytochrome c oxidase subunit 4
MSDHHSDADLKRHVRGYILVFAALLLGTALTVGMYYIHIPSVAITITVALFIATIKAFLVAGFFMHLISEKKAIYAILATTAFFFVGLAGLTLWSMHDFPMGTKY